VTIPSQIGRYAILGELGKGAMGIVYRGRDESLERDVAIKVLLGQAVDATARERFQREARAVARLQHANIVTIYELGEHEDAPFIAMELLEGLDLQRAIQSGIRPDPKATLPVVLQILAGLTEAHDHGIVHRDMKPSNVFLPHRRAAKIMDFGLARMSDSGASTTGEIAGTPNYMSPEQVRGTRLDGRSDLFSTGLILYELVTGEKAFPGDSIVSLLFKIAHEDADLSLIPQGVEWDRLRGVLTRALRRDREERYPDARTMAGDLSAALADLGGAPDWAAAPSHQILLVPWTAIQKAAARTAEVERPVTDRALSGPTPAPVPAFGGAAAARASEHRRLLWLSGGLAGLACAILAGALALYTRKDAPAETPSAPPSSTVPAATTKAPSTFPPTTTPTVPPEPAPTAPPATAEPAPPATAPPTPSLERANALLEQRRYAAALETARAILAADPGNAEARIIAEDAEVGLAVERCLSNGRTALDKGDRDLAMEEIKACQAIAPSDARLIQLWREATQ
jgi:eukaryotic-like serine/threonine-protein kinase